MPDSLPKQTPLFLVADAYKGLLLALSGGDVISLLTVVEGKPLYFANAIARAQNGIIYLSDSSIRFRRNKVLLEVLESRQTGRVIAWDPDTGVSRVVIDQLPFPNGIVLQKNDQHLLISLTTRQQIVKLDLTDASAHPQLFVALPGPPDNLHISYIEEWGQPVLWVGLSTKSSIITQWMNGSSNLRKVIAMLPPHKLLNFFKQYGIFVGLDVETGKILHSYQDPEGSTPFIACTHFDEKHGYIGSWKNHFIAKILREKLFLVNLRGIVNMHLT